MGKKHETSFDIFFHRIQWFLHAWTFCTITYIRLMGRNGTRPSNEPCKTCAKHAQALTPCACTGWYGQRWPKVIPTGDTANFLRWLWSVNRSNRLWPKDWQRVFLRLFWSCTLPKCSSTATKYHVQPSTTIKWDWNNVYGVGGPYHYDCIPWITVESLLWWKMASNCQIVPLAPEKNSDSDSDFPTFKPTTYL